MSERKFRNFTFKIDVDYIVRGLYPNATVTQFAALEQSIYEQLCQNFANFVANYKDSQGVNIYHDCDLKHKEIDGKIVYELDSVTKKPKPDDKHVHFVFWGASNAQTETKWREALDRFGLHLTDQNRSKKQEKDFKELKKKKLAHAIAYLLHRTARSIRDHKYAYDESKANLFNVSREEYEDLLAKGIDDNQQQLADKEMTALADELTEQIRHGLTLTDAKNLSIQTFKDKQPQFWRAYHTALEHERDEYIAELFHQLVYRERNFSLFYLWGSGGAGKSYIANQLAYYFADVSDHAVHTTTPNGKGKTPDFLSTYRNELVSVAHEFKPTQISVDEFENLFEPKRYPTVNSRNNDKPYLAQSTIITNSLDAPYWIYNMLYSDYCRKDGASMRYGWRNKINNKEKNGKIKEETMAFPKTYVKFLGLRKNKEETPWKRLHVFPDDGLTEEEIAEHEQHWNLKGALRFLDDYWQVLRRMRYVIHVQSEENEDSRTKTLYFQVYELMEGSKPKCLKDEGKNNISITVEEFFDEFDFNAHYHLVGNYTCKNMESLPALHEQLENLIHILKLNGLKIDKHLPKLLTDSELNELMHGIPVANSEQNEQSNEEMHIVKSE